MSYNGWSNYETWNVGMWMGNDEGLYDAMVDLTEWVCRHETDKASATYALSKAMKEFIDEGAPVVTGMYADLLTAALNEVNYYEIAEHWVDDYWEKDDEVGPGGIADREEYLEGIE